MPKYNVKILIGRHEIGDGILHISNDMPSIASNELTEAENPADVVAFAIERAVNEAMEYAVRVHVEHVE